MDDNIDESFETLLGYLRDARGFDFTGYKRTSLARRVRHRMDQAGFETYEAYLDELQANADEFGALFNTILINVTAISVTPKPGTCCATRSFLRFSPSEGRAIPSGCGARGVPPARRRTPSPCS